MIGEVLDAFGNTVPTRMLIDTGTSQTLGLAHMVSKLSPKACKQNKHTAWKTMGGTLKTKQKRLMNFKSPEFSTARKISWAIHADEKNDPQKASCDLIIGTDLMEELGIDARFSDKRAEWDGT